MVNGKIISSDSSDYKKLVKGAIISSNSGDARLVILKEQLAKNFVQLYPGTVLRSKNKMVLKWKSILTVLLNTKNK